MSDTERVYALVLMWKILAESQRWLIQSQIGKRTGADL